MPVDKRRLKKHKANKERLKRLEEKIQDLCSTEAEEVMGKLPEDQANTFPTQKLGHQW